MQTTHEADRAAPAASPPLNAAPPPVPITGYAAFQRNQSVDAAGDEKQQKIAYVSHQNGDSHLRLQLSDGNNDRKTFNRPVAESLSKLRYRLHLMVAKASAIADSPCNESSNHKDTRKQDHHSGNPAAAQVTSDVRFYSGDEQEIVDDALAVGEALNRVDRIEIGSDTFIVLHNQPQVVQVSVMEPIFAGIPVLPMAETEFCTADECTWRWHRIDDQGTELEVGTDRIHCPSVSDIGCRFRVECHAPSLHSCMVQNSTTEVLTSAAVVGPDRSVFAKRQALAKQRASGNGFRVMSYNVLFDGYTSTMQAKMHMFPYAKREALEEAYRVQLVCQEITEANADIVCLQEMGCTIFHSFFQPMLQRQGFHTFYTGKTGSTHEGCAVLVRSSAFTVEEQLKIDLTEAILTCQDPQVDSLLTEFPELRVAIDKIPSIAQVLLLSDTRSHRRVVLVNTHLFYREDGDMIRLLQAVALVHAIEKLQRRLRDERDHETEAAVVFCGDLNAFPDTATTQFLLDGVVDHTHRHWQEALSFVWDRSAANAASPTASRTAVQPGSFHHSQSLVSACGIPSFTNFAGSFVGTLDYILLGASQLRVATCFPLFTREEVEREVALPSTVFPSDHISLIADMEWIADGW